MKKFIKIFLILAVVLIVAGFSLSLAARLTVGNEGMSQAVEEVTHGKVNLDLSGLEEWGVTVKDSLELELPQEGFFDIEDASTFDRDREIWEGNLDKRQIAQGEVKQLSLEAAGSVLELEQSPDDAYYLEAQNAGKVQAYLEDGILYVKSVRPAKIASEIRGSRIVLYVPAGAVYEEVRISFGAGELKTDGLRADTVVIELGAGAADIEHLTADSLSASVGAGQLELEDVRLGELVQLEIGAGNCRLEGSVAGDIQAECGMGNLDLELEAAEREYDYEVQCVAGRVTVDGETYTGLNSAKIVDNGAGRMMNLTCAMGNIRVTFEGAGDSYGNLFDDRDGYDDHDDDYDDHDDHDDDHDDHDDDYDDHDDRDDYDGFFPWDF